MSLKYFFCDFHRSLLKQGGPLCDRLASSLSLQQVPGPGLPDFSWGKIPRLEKDTKWTQNVPDGHKISQMAVKYSKWP
jgi:hypothetical protein